MTASRRDEGGETLIEIVIALVIIGLVVGSFFAAFVTAATSSTAHRDLVTADAVLRDYAEATKAAVRTSCPVNPTYTVSYAPNFFPQRPGFTPSPTPGTAQPCAASVTTVKQVDLAVALPNGTTKHLTINVRTP